MFDGEGFGETEHQGAFQMSAGGFMLTASKNNVAIIQARLSCQRSPSRGMYSCTAMDDSPNIEVFGVTGATPTTEETESHDEGPRRRR